MNAKELRELDVWIAGHVFGCAPIYNGNVAAPYWECQCPNKPHVGASRDEWLYGEIARYTTDPAAAMEALKKCGDVCIDSDSKRISNLSGTISTIGDTLEISICLYLKKLFLK